MQCNLCLGLLITQGPGFTCEGFICVLCLPGITIDASRTSAAPVIYDTASIYDVNDGRVCFSVGLCQAGADSPSTHYSREQNSSPLHWRSRCIGARAAKKGKEEEWVEERRKEKKE